MEAEIETQPDNFHFLPQLAICENFYRRINLGCGASLSQRNREQPIQFFCGLDLKAAAANSKSNSYTSRQRTT